MKQQSPGCRPDWPGPCEQPLGPRVCFLRQFGLSPTNTKTSPRSPPPALSCFWGTAPHTPRSKAAPQKGHAGQVKGFLGHFCNVLFIGVGSRGTRSTGPPHCKAFPRRSHAGLEGASLLGALFSHTLSMWREGRVRVLQPCTVYIY